MGTLTAEGFPRSWRLSAASEIRAVMRAGHRARGPRIEVFWIGNSLGHPRLGVLVPRYGATAVRRNRLRRRLKEAARRGILPGLGGVDLVLRARPAAYQASFRQLAADLAQWRESLAT